MLAKAGDSFAWVGSILYFEDTDIIKDLQGNSLCMPDNFLWSEQASGMAQLSVWTTLAANVGLHYNTNQLLMMSSCNLGSAKT